MSRNGSGTYNLPAGNPVVSGTTITSSWANTTMQNIADGLTQSVASDGQTTMSGALNMGNNKVISVTDPTNAQDAATKNYTDTAITTAGATYLLKASNLSDVANATTARGNLTAAKSGANSDITSITGLTTALTVAQGGTGAATLTANNVLLGNGTSALQAVAPGTSGNVLTSNGTTWVSSSSSKVLQVVSVALTSIFSSSSTSYTDVTGLSVSITPTSATSKILVRVDITGGASSLAIYQLMRGSTAIGIGDLVSGHGQSTTQPSQWQGSNGDRGSYVGMTFLDSPATTSATTYKIQGFCDSGTFYVNRSSSYSATAVGTGSISTITVMEIAA